MEDDDEDDVNQLNCHCLVEKLISSAAPLVKKFPFFLWNL
jgi:hypothetical protein